MIDRNRSITAKNIRSPAPPCLIAPELSTLGKVFIIPQIIKQADITANIFHRPCFSFLIFAPQYSQNAELLSISCLQLGHFIISILFYIIDSYKYIKKAGLHCCCSAIRGSSMTFNPEQTTLKPTLICIYTLLYLTI